MKLEKAIELMGDELNRPGHNEDPDFLDALKVGIKAAKCIEAISDHIKEWVRSSRD